MSTNPPAWYIRGEGNKPSGPCTTDQLLQLLRAGRVGSTTLCWREGMAEWLPLVQVEPFASAIRASAQGPAAPVRAKSAPGVPPVLPKRSIPDLRRRRPTIALRESLVPLIGCGIALVALLTALAVILLGSLGGIGDIVGVVDPYSDLAVQSKARKDIESRLVHCGDSWYGYDLHRFSLVEIKGLSITAEGRDLTAADRANGIQWEGRVLVECDLYRSVPVRVDRDERRTVRLEGQWGEWQRGGRIQHQVLGTVVQNPLDWGSSGVDLIIRNGRWDWSVNFVERPNFACDSIPK